MTLNGPMNRIDSTREAFASNAVRDDTEEYQPSIDELISSAREEVARLAQILRQFRTQPSRRFVNAQRRHRGRRALCCAPAAHHTAMITFYMNLTHGPSAPLRRTAARDGVRQP
jgi:hypothetical protein